MTRSAALPAALKRRQLGLLRLVMVTFFIVSGGPYGLEEVVGESGPRIALLLLVVTPLIWAIPTALMVAELSSMMPVEGGFYAWVKRALGPFWGFLEGWWSWLASFVDMALYPVLFGNYLVSLLERLGLVTLGDDALLRWAVGLLVIWPFALLNVRGARPVGTLSVLFGLLVLAPFAVMSYLGLSQLGAIEVATWEQLTRGDRPLLDAFGVGLFVVMWNYSGWDSVSTVGEEIDRPQRTIPLTLLIAVPLITLVYLLPTLAGLVGTPDPREWTEGALPDVAAALGGDWLGVWVAVVGMVTAAGLFSGNLLSVSRLPFVMAADGYLPKGIAAIHPRWGTPWISILVCAAIYTIFSFSSFASLVVVDVILYAATILLELAALVALRINAPEAARPYRIPGGWVGVSLVVLLPTAVLALAIVATAQSEGAGAVYLSAAGLASGVVLFPVLRFVLKRDTPDVYVPLEGEAREMDWLGERLPALVPRARPQWR